MDVITKSIWLSCKCSLIATFHNPLIVKDVGWVYSICIQEDSKSCQWTEGRNGCYTADVTAYSFTSMHSYMFACLKPFWNLKTSVRRTSFLSLSHTYTTSTLIKLHESLDASLSSVILTEKFTWNSEIIISNKRILRRKQGTHSPYHFDAYSFFCDICSFSVNRKMRLCRHLLGAEIAHLGVRVNKGGY